MGPLSKPLFKRNNSMNDFNSTVSVERVKELLSYDPETGVFTWKIDRCHKARKGAAAGSLSESGYLEIRISKRNFGSTD